MSKGGGDKKAKIAKAEGGEPKDSQGRKLRQKAKSQIRFLAFSLSL
jgi:hypothetical protein